MPTRSPSRCPGCKRLHTGTGSCSACRRANDRARGTAAQRGYTCQHLSRFRADVLKRDPVCVLCTTRPATVADHHPLSRRELVAQGLDPNDPRHGRGLCASCHGIHTARAQPGGWNQR